MNRLSYAKKFGLISLTFFIPLVLLSYAIINQTYLQIKKADLEKESLTKIQFLLKLSDDAIAYRDLASVHMINTTHSEIEKESVKLEVKFIKSVNVLINQYPNTPLAEDLQTALPKWKKLLSRSGENRQTFIGDQFKVFDQVVTDVLYLANKVAQSSGILLDSNLDVQVALKLILNQYPDYKKPFGLAYTSGVYAVTQKYLSGTIYDLLNSIYDGMDENIKAITLTHKTLLKNPVFSQLFKDKFPKIENDLIEVRNMIDEEIISASSVNMSWQDFSAYYFKRLAGFEQVRDISISHLEVMLTERIEVLTQKLIIVAVAIVLVMLLIVYLYAAFFWSVRSTVGAFHNAAHKISLGDMRVRVSVDSKDEMGELTSEFNVMVEKIHSLMQAVQGTSTEVASSMGKVGKNATQSENAANEQLAQTEQVASAITQMAATAEEVNRQSGEAANSAAQATNQAGEANKVVSETLGQITALADEIMRSTEVINTLSDNSENIASMLAVIKGIAEQTNLLALNAAIEAARAGEQGRGFAVVADEVRTLASRTQASAQEIDEVMTSIHDGISSAVEVMGNSHMMAQDTVESSSQVRVALDQIVEMVKNISDINGQISASAGEQTQVARTIDENVVKINELGKDTVSDAQHTVAAIKEVIKLTESLQEKMERFQV